VQPSRSADEEEQARTKSLAVVHADMKERFGSKIAALVLEVVRSLKEGRPAPK
jgi:hypothetical protein